MASPGAAGHDVVQPILPQLGHGFEQRAGIGRLGGLEELGRRAVLDDPALLHHHRTLGEAADFVGEEGAAEEFRGCLGRILSAATQQELATLLQKAGQEGLSAAERERLATLQRTVVAGTASRNGTTT